MLVMKTIRYVPQIRYRNLNEVIRDGHMVLQVFWAQTVDNIVAFLEGKPLRLLA